MKKKIVIGLLLIFVTGCSMYKQNIIYELLDEGTINFKSMNEKEKNEIYEELDEVTKLEDTEKKAADYSSFVHIDSMDDYNSIINLSDKTPVIIYFGYEECSYCQAFMPKINQLALNYDQEIYYYQINNRRQDHNFSSVMSWMGNDTVPYAVLVDKGKIVESLDHNSSVKEIEDIIKEI